MRSFFRDQTEFFINGAAGSRAGTNMAGELIRDFEDNIDRLWDYGIGKFVTPKSAALAAGAGLIAGGAYLNQKGYVNDSISYSVAAGLGAGTLFGILGARGGAAREAVKSFEAKGFGELALRGAFGLRSGLTAGIVVGAGTYALMTGNLGNAAAVMAGGIGASLLGAGALRAAARGFGGPIGAGIALGGIGRAIGSAIYTGFRAFEGVARFGLTSGPREWFAPLGARHGATNALDAWFPFFRNSPFENLTEREAAELTAQNLEFLKSKVGAMPWQSAGVKNRINAKLAERAKINPGPVIDPRKFAPNPRIPRRLVGISAISALGAGFQEMLSPGVARPTAFFDGRYVRHINDRGANAHYAESVLGQNSLLNEDYSSLARAAAMMF